MAYEYTTITCDLTANGSGGASGTIYAELFHTVTLANNDTVAPQKYSATVTSGAATLTLPCTATAVSGRNAPFLVTFVPTGGAVRTLGRIIPTESAAAVQLSDLLEVGATSAYPVTRKNVDATNLTIAASIAQLQAMRGLTDGDRVLVEDVGLFRYDDGSALGSDETSVVTPASGVGRWLLEVAGLGRLPFVDVRNYGAGSSIVDNYAAFAAAIAAARPSTSTCAVVYIPGGTYSIATGLTIPAGVVLLGDSGYGQGTWSQLSYTGTGDFITFNGAEGVGGGKIQNLLISRATNSGGDAIKLVATSTAARPGEFVIHNVLVASYDGVQTWGRGLHIDGTAANTVGTKGVRNIRIDKLRVADVSTAGESVYINQATHLFATHLQVDQGYGAAAGIKTAGETTNLMLTGVVCNGDMVLAGTLGNAKVIGYVAGDLNIGASCTGVDVLANGATLTVADGARGTASGYWTGTITNANDAKFAVTNVNDSRRYVGNQVVAGGYVPSSKAAVAATTSLGSVFNAYPVDSTAQQAGYYAYNPATTNAAIFEVAINRAKFGSPNATPVDLMYAGTAKATIGPNGVKFGDTTAPTARVHVAAGTTAAGTAPVKLTQGDLMTSAENGAVEFDTNGYLYFTGSGTTRDRVFTGCQATAELDFPSIAAGASADLTFTLTGAANGQAVIPMWPPSLPAGLVGTMFVSAADTITVRLANNTASAIDYGSATFGATVLR